MIATFVSAWTHTHGFYHAGLNIRVARWMQMSTEATKLKDSTSPSSSSKGKVEGSLNQFEFLGLVPELVTSLSTQGRTNLIDRLHHLLSRQV
jgi:hypothetical protein